MRVGIMQPTYLPYPGYFELVASSDVFVLMDDVQYEPKSWQNRNRIKGPNGEVMLTVPVKTAGRRFQKLYEVEIDNSQPWQEKHWRTIIQNYKKARYWRDYSPLIEAILHREFVSLVSLDTVFLRVMLDLMGIKTPLYLASNFRLPETNKEQHIIDIMKSVGGDILYDAGGAEAILDQEPFREAGIRLEFQHYEPQSYTQQFRGFVPYLSALDLLLNEGPASKEIILRGRRDGTVNGGHREFGAEALSGTI